MMRRAARGDAYAVADPASPLDEVALAAAAAPLAPPVLGGIGNGDVGLGYDGASIHLGSPRRSTMTIPSLPLRRRVRPLAR